MPLQIQQLNHHDLLTKFYSEVDVEWVVQKLLRMKWWIAAPCNLECVPCSDEKGFDSSGKGNGLPLGKIHGG